MRANRNREGETHHPFLILLSLYEIGNIISKHEIEINIVIKKEIGIEIEIDRSTYMQICSNTKHHNNNIKVYSFVLEYKKTYNLNFNKTK